MCVERERERGGGVVSRCPQCSIPQTLLPFAPPPHRPTTQPPLHSATRPPLPHARPRNGLTVVEHAPVRPSTSEHVGRRELVSITENGRVVTQIVRPLDRRGFCIRVESYGQHAGVADLQRILPPVVRGVVAVVEHHNEVIAVVFGAVLACPKAHSSVEKIIVFGGVRHVRAAIDVDKGPVSKFTPHRVVQRRVVGLHCAGIASNRRRQQRKSPVRKRITIPRAGDHLQGVPSLNVVGHGCKSRLWGTGVDRSRVWESQPRASHEALPATHTRARSSDGSSGGARRAIIL